MTPASCAEYHSTDFDWRDLKVAAEEFLRARADGKTSSTFEFEPARDHTPRAVSCMEQGSTDSNSTTSFLSGCSDPEFIERLPSETSGFREECREIAGCQPSSRVLNGASLTTELENTFGGECREESRAENSRLNEGQGSCRMVKTSEQVPGKFKAFAKEEKAQNPWETFHRRHVSAQFFKPRRYLLSAFPELSHLPAGSRVLEVGCGSGSSIVPLLQALPQVSACACDVSQTAVELCMTSAQATLGERDCAARLCAFHCDVSTDEIRCPHAPGASADDVSCLVLEEPSKESSPEGSAALPLSSSSPGGGSLRPSAEGSRCDHSHPSCPSDGWSAALLIFTLSAFHPCDIPGVLRRVKGVLKPGGLVCFRDYGLYDMTMMRFDGRQREEECLFRREDGTLSFFFELERTRSLFTSCGYECEELEYCCVLNVNRRKGKNMWRVWINGKFRVRP